MPQSNRPRRSAFVVNALLTALFVVATPAAAQRFEVRDDRGLRWFKGNTHAHTAESDGDSPPAVVAAWYKSHGYSFLVLSDHNVRVDPASLASLIDSSFLLIAGEEVTSSFQQKPVHVNGLNILRLVQPLTDSTLVGTIQKNVDAVRAASGVPHINHPNFRWAFGISELLQVRNDRLLEIWNGHPQVHNEGGGDKPGLEEIWDALLSAGKRVYGIAVDDAHHFEGEFAPDRANPGRGWIAVRASRLDAAEIMQNLENGLFYASTGVDLDDIIVTPERMEVRIRQQGDFRYTTTFIGEQGRVLHQTGDNPAIYTLRDHTSYVRARVTDSGSARAWVQPVFVTLR
ncbi:MAG: CehA/McbA family metallohydrolase [Gemmatimonadetes bacterium]|nr:CehA/McbA family metallohydrolase [Gemmatimonadota bacterium]